MHCIQEAFDSNFKLISNGKHFLQWQKPKSLKGVLIFKRAYKISKNRDFERSGQDLRLLVLSCLSFSPSNSEECFRKKIHKMFYANKTVCVRHKGSFKKRFPAESI